MFAGANSQTASLLATPSTNGVQPRRSSVSRTMEDENRERQTLEQSLHKSITLVLWYRAKSEPIRLNHEVATFPLFQLTAFANLVKDLKLDSTSYVDTYNPAAAQWEQHGITTVRVVEHDQRLLYKLRKSLFDALDNGDCPGLSSEVAAQIRGGGIPRNMTTAFAPQKTLSKRPAPEPTELPANKYYIAARYSGQQEYSIGQYAVPTPQSYPQSLSAPSQPSLASSTVPSSTSAKRPFDMQPGVSLYAAPAPLPAQSVALEAAQKSPSSDSSAPIPYHPHPPLKRWPNDYTVSQISSGFSQMDALIAQTPNLTQRAAFERVFGCRYVKSTVCRHRGLWRRADAALRKRFETMGEEELAVWNEFVRCVEGRPSGRVVPSVGDQLSLGDANRATQQEEDEQAVESTLVPLHSSNALASSEIPPNSIPLHPPASQLTTIQHSAPLAVYNSPLPVSNQSA